MQAGYAVRLVVDQSHPPAAAGLDVSVGNWYSIGWIPESLFTSRELHAISMGPFPNARYGLIAAYRL